MAEIKPKPKIVRRAHPVAHFRTITLHRNLVCRYCFRLGLYRQGLVHDLSKYGPAEFLAGVRYYQGDRSPNDEERIETGISRAWLHHKGRNKHHFEYWVDYVRQPDGHVNYTGQKMPIRYVAEMFCDRIAACKTYLGDKSTDASPWVYFQKGKNDIPIHPETAAELEEMLRILKDEGEDAAFRYVRRRLRAEKW